MSDTRWVHLATAPDQITAELWVGILQAAGIPALIRSSDAVSFLGVSGFGTRLQVPESELERAREILGDDLT
jgi:hypothetical protein